MHRVQAAQCKMGIVSIRVSVAAMVLGVVHACRKKFTSHTTRTQMKAGKACAGGVGAAETKLAAELFEEFLLLVFSIPVSSGEGGGL